MFHCNHVVINGDYNIEWSMCANCMRRGGRGRLRRISAYMHEKQCTNIFIKQLVTQHMSDTNARTIPYVTK